MAKIASDGKIYVQTLKEVALFCRASLHTVNGWRKDGWMPARTSKGWELSEICHLRLDRVRSTPQADSESRSLQQRRGTKLGEEIRKLTIENDEREGRLVAKEDVRRDAMKWSHAFRLELMGLPHTIANIVPGKLKSQVLQASQEEITLALEKVRDRAIYAENVEEMILAEAEAIREEKTPKKKKPKSRRKKRERAN